jgi:hypothetical protein
MPSRARNYFDEFVPRDSEGKPNLPEALTRIRALIGAKEPRFEDDWLEYKSGKLFNNYFAAQNGSAEHKRLADNPKSLPYEAKKKDYKFYEQWKTALKNVWAQYLSAFANNEGGVMIWGIYGAKGKNEQGNEVDAPNEEHLIDDLPAALTALQTFQNDALDPPLTGVVNVAIPASEDGKSGFIVSYIPNGAVRPYQARFDENRIYLRHGGSSSVASHTLVRMMCIQERAYSARVYMQTLQKVEENVFKCALTIENTGLLTIVNPQISIETEKLVFTKKQLSPHSMGTSKQLILRPKVDVHYRTLQPFEFFVAGEPDPEILWQINVSIKDSLPLHGQIRKPFPFGGAIVFELKRINPEDEPLDPVDLLLKRAAKTQAN